MKNITVIVVAFVALGIAYLFLKHRKDLINLAGALSQGKTTTPLSLLPGTNIPTGLKPRPGNGIPLPTNGIYIPETLPFKLSSLLEQAKRIRPDIFKNFGL